MHKKTQLLENVETDRARLGEKDKTGHG